MKEPPVWYVPRDDIDYYMQTGKLPKALAAHAAEADLNGVRVPIRQQDGTYKDAQDAVMTREDMADYFTRLRAAQAVASQQEAAAEVMDDDDEVEAAAASVILVVNIFLLENLNPVELRKDQN